MSFLTTLISSFPLLSYSIHHITLSSSHFHSHLISSHHTSHHHSHSLLFHRIHLFILTTFHAFSHHLICITLITSHIHLSFIPHHPHSILLPFHHSRIFHFSTHPFHHGALRDFLKTHFHSFHSSYHSIHYSILISILFQFHHPHHHTFLLFIIIRIYVLYPFISIHSHPILPLSHFNHTHSYPFPFLHISFHSILSFSFILYLSIDSSFLDVQWYTRPLVSIAHFSLIHFYSHSSICHPTHIIHLFSSLLIFFSQLCDQSLFCSDTCYRIIICCVDKKHSLLFRGTSYYV